MNLKLLLITIIILTVPASARNIKGVVTDEEGKPISYATIYIKSLQYGVTTNLDGSFDIPIPAGTYDCEVGAFEYTTMICRIEADSESLTVRLKPRVYIIPPFDSEVNDSMVTDIIQKAVSRASYNRNLIDSYSADLYIKGRGELENVPFLQMYSKSNRQISKKYLHKLFVTEKNYHVDYISPYVYNFRLIADTHPLPYLMKPDIKVTTANIYEQRIFDKLSPISPQASHYYKYKLVCILTDNGRTIYKIRITPRHLDTELVSGYIYIVDKLWCISAFDLLIYNSHIVTNIKVRCAEVRPSVFIPICSSSEMDIHRDGIHTLAHYSHSIHYSDIKLNSNEAKIIPRHYYLQGSRRFERLRPRDLARLTGDTLVCTGDSALWNGIRPVPLLPEEQISYQRIVPDKKIQPFHAKDWSDIRTWYNLLRYGDTFRSRNGNFWINCYNIASCIPDYNFVDGFWLGYKMGFGVRLSNTTSIVLTPGIYYTTARQKWVGSGNITFNYAPRWQGKFSVEGGSLTDDYNQETGESRIFNAVSALIYADNYIKLFNKRYLTVKNQIEAANGLLVTTTFNWQNRTMIENRIHHSILGQNAEVNHPQQALFFFMAPNKLMSSSILLQYTPIHYYKMVGNSKVYEDTESPTISFKYTQAYSIGSTSLSPRFSKIEAGISQTINAGLFNRFIWNAETGLFFNKKNIQFPDYHHFPTVQNTSSRRPFSYGFFLLDCYTYSTPDRWLMVNTTWNTPYLLIKYLPMFRYKNFDEAIHVRLLATPDECPYLECGYSAGVKDISRVGFFISYDKHGYHSVGVSLSFSM